MLAPSCGEIGTFQCSVLTKGRIIIRADFGALQWYNRKMVVLRGSEAEFQFYLPYDSALWCNGNNAALYGD